MHFAVIKSMGRAHTGPMMRILGLVLILASPVFGDLTMNQPLCKRLESPAFDYAAIADKVGLPSTDLGLALTEKISGKSPNRLLSPWSLYAVLAQLEPGARGKTREELRQLLYGDRNADRVELVADAGARLVCTNEYTSTVVHSANRLFLEKSLALQPDYFATVERLFGASSGRVDYLARPAAAAKEINEWVSLNTKGKIPSIVQPNQINKETRLILVNALYLFGTWWKKFDPARTKEAPFRLAGGTSKPVPLMHLEGNEMDFRYGKVGGIEALEMGFADREASMLIVLPDGVDGLGALRKKLDGKKMREIRKSLEQRRVNVTLPRFKLSASHDLVDSLKALGGKTLFERGVADFSGIDAGKHLLYVAAVLQKVTVDVTELGFEGAAATAAMMAAGSAPPRPSKPVEFKVDRPFAFVVESSRIDVPLFVGYVGDPTVLN